MTQLSVFRVSLTESQVKGPARLQMQGRNGAVRCMYAETKKAGHKAFDRHDDHLHVAGAYGPPATLTTGKVVKRTERQGFKTPRLASFARDVM